MSGIIFSETAIDDNVFCNAAQKTSVLHNAFKDRAKIDFQNSYDRETIIWTTKIEARTELRRLQLNIAANLKNWNAGGFLNGKKRNASHYLQFFLDN